MKKSEMVEINNEVLSAWEKTENVLALLTCECKRLRHCKAWVHETDDFYFLQSYGTIVAFIDKSTDTLYDVLRYVYGYTATSAQHISKFDQDYGTGKWGCAKRLTYYPI